MKKTIHYSYSYLRRWGGGNALHSQEEYKKICYPGGYVNVNANKCQCQVILQPRLARHQLQPTCFPTNSRPSRSRAVMRGAAPLSILQWAGYKCTTHSFSCHLGGKKTPNRILLSPRRIFFFLLQYLTPKRHMTGAERCIGG